MCLLIKRGGKIGAGVVGQRNVPIGKESKEKLRHCSALQPLFPGGGLIPTAIGLCAVAYLHLLSHPRKACLGSHPPRGWPFVSLTCCLCGRLVDGQIFL